MDNFGSMILIHTVKFSIFLLSFFDPHPFHGAAMEWQALPRPCAAWSLLLNCCHGKMGADSEVEPSDFLDGTFRHIPSGKHTKSY